MKTYTVTELDVLSFTRQCLIAIAAVFVALLLTLLLGEAVHLTPFALFYGAVALAASIGGFKVGLLATALAILLAEFLVIPSLPLMPASTTDLRHLFLFAGVSAFMSWIHDVQRSGRQKRSDILAENAQQHYRLRQILDNLPALAGMVMPDGTLVEANQGALDLANLKREDVIGKPFDQTYWWAYDPALQMQLRDAISRAMQGEMVRYDAVVRTGEERFATIDFFLSPIRDANGKITALLPSAVDITERLRMEQEREQLQRQIAQGRERLETILQHVPCIVWEGMGKPDGTQRVLYVNSYAETLLGYSTERWLADRPIWLDISLPEDLPSAVEQAMQIYEGTQPGVIEFRVYAADRHIVHIAAYAVMMRNRVGSDEGRMIGIIVDVSERKRQEALIERYVKRLQTSNEELQRFASVASHDLQEPLRMIASYLQLINERYGDRLDADGAEFMRFALDGAGRMKLLINDLLVFSQVDMQEACYTQVDMNEVLHQVKSDLALAISETQALILAPVLPTITADAGQMVRLLENLLSNAIKFCKDTPPEIRISAHKTDGATHFSVQDNGIGIDPKHQAHIFALFQRLHSRTKYPGTGIGLAICKRVVERHGGKIWYTSEPGKGATFHFTIADQLQDEPTKTVDKMA
ncbi:MAG: ATP-binding protein [Chloroflexota bacterium]|nr:ATP-binding protein [Chloroflexota bacterium]